MFSQAKNLDNLIKISVDPQRDEYFRTIADNAYSYFERNYLDYIYFIEDGDTDYTREVAFVVPGDIWDNFEFKDIMNTYPSVVIKETSSYGGNYQIYDNMTFQQGDMQESSGITLNTPAFPEDQTPLEILSSDFIESVIKRGYVTFLHEFIHYLDYNRIPAGNTVNMLDSKEEWQEKQEEKRRKLLGDYPKLEDADSIKDFLSRRMSPESKNIEKELDEEEKQRYYNSPIEYNAYSQTLLTIVENRRLVEKLMQNNPDVSPQDFIYMVMDENFLGGRFHSFISYLNDTNNKKLINRLYQFFNFKKNNILKEKKRMDATQMLMKSLLNP